MKSINIALFAPSGPVTRAETELAIRLIEEDLASAMDLPVAFDTSGLDLCGTPPFSHLAGEDRKQAELFTHLACRPDLHFLWAVRGGYGSSRWMDLVDWEAMATGRPTPLLIGFSDVTFLHGAVTNMVSRPGIHGPMLNTWRETDGASKTALMAMLAGGAPPSLQATCLKPGRAEGRLLGGNLTCICHSIGTMAEPRGEGFILFIEDVSEPLYKLDRMLTHLLTSGILARAAGVAVGRLSPPAGAPEDWDDLCRALVADRLSGLSLPVVVELPCGHSPFVPPPAGSNIDSSNAASSTGPSQHSNMPLLLGATYLLDATPEGPSILSPL